MLATYVRRMRSNNLEIRIAGSSCRSQFNGYICKIYGNPDCVVKRRDLNSPFELSHM